MRIAVFSTKPYDERFINSANERHGFELTYFEPRLVHETSGLAGGYQAVCVFVNDRLDREVLEAISGRGVRYVALRCAGFNNVDLHAARDVGIRVVRVPAYSPHAVAEHTVALILMLNRKLHRAYSRVRELNFSLNGLLGFDMVGRTVGVVGTGQIGATTARILQGFGCRLLAYDVRRNPQCVELGIAYVSLDELLRQSDIVTLHCPLNPATHHLIDAGAIEKMKPGVMLINTSRGGVVDTRAVIEGLKSGAIGYLGLDVYEEEADVFFEDLSDNVVTDDVLARLLTFPNVVITGHQAFFTEDALQAIADTTLDNLAALASSGTCANEVLPSKG